MSCVVLIPVLISALFASVGALAPTEAIRTSTLAYNRLQSVSLVRASDNANVRLTSLWKTGVLGVGTETAAIVFLRHFG